MKKNKRPKFAPLAVIVFIITSILLIISRNSVDAADKLDAALSSPYRRFMASIGDIFHFSLFEIIILLIPLFIIIIIWRSITVFGRGYGRARFVANILAVALLLYSGNSIALGISYNTAPIDEKLSLPEVLIDEQTLSDALIELCLEVNAVSEDVYFSDGESQSEYTLDEISEKLCKSFDSLAERNVISDSFDSRVKGVDALNILSYLRLSGIYTYYTGEANVNTDYPDYEIVFTSAHEMSHQRGIMREDEASFIGYLACSESEDVYLRYSAALAMLDYVGTALWRTNPDAYYEIMESLDERAMSDLRASWAVTTEYGDTFLADISSRVNDLFLKSNGTDGVITYSRVVTLYISYRQTK